jgi:hypothetical protein
VAEDGKRRAATGGGANGGRRAGAEPRRADDSKAEERVSCPVAFCPICTAVSTMERAGPEVVQHLLLAGQQFLLALKALVDARAADFEGEAAEPSPSMERIDIG